MDKSMKAGKLSVPCAHVERCVDDEATQFIGMANNRSPECVHGPTDVVNVDTGNIVMKKKLNCDAASAGIGLYILAIEN